MTVRSLLTSIAVNRDGLLRAIWRTLLFFGIGNLVAWPLSYPTIALAHQYPVLDQLSWQAIALGESTLFVMALVPTALFARYERRRVDSYGLPLAQAFSAQFWEGAAMGVVAPALVGIGMLALGGWRIQGLNLHGLGLLVLPLAWLLANVVIGFSEELWYRGYMLQTLTKSLGFWPATVILTCLFVADHYFFKQGENLYDVVTLASFAILICLTVRRTGALWFAVGFHIAFDFMQLFVIGTQNGSQTPVGALFASTFPGPAWVNGGVLGTEASVLMYPVTFLMYLFVLRRYPKDVALTGGPEDLPIKN